MGKIITRLFGRRDAPEEQETAPMRYREPTREPFAAGWVTDDGKLRDEPPVARAPERRPRD
jgi:hypothetical protein